MWWRGLLFALILNASAHAAAESTHHYVDPTGKAIALYEPIWRTLFEAFSEHAPDRIVVEFAKSGFSRFDTRDDRVLIRSGYSPSLAMAKIAHESAHLAAHNITNGYSIQNRFRFIDEGFASVFESRVAGRAARFKKYVLAVAAHQQRADNVRMHLVQDWRRYWGNWRKGRGRQTSYAYPVGASVIHFLVDMYGAGSPIRLMKAIGETGNFDAATRLSLNRSGQEIETGWIKYLQAVTIPDAGSVNIVRMDPPNGATEVRPDLHEITVEFNTPMARDICIRTNSCDEICYRNARWKSPSVLAIKLPVGLRPNESYILSLGSREGCKLKSAAMSDLPVTIWKFATARRP